MSMPHLLQCPRTEVLRFVHRDGAVIRRPRRFCTQEVGHFAVGVVDLLELALGELATVLLARGPCRIPLGPAKHNPPPGAAGGPVMVERDDALSQDDLLQLLLVEVVSQAEATRLRHPVPNVAAQSGQSRPVHDKYERRRR